MPIRVTRGGKTRRLGHDDAYTPTPVADGFQLSTGVGRFAGAKFLALFVVLWTGFSSLFVFIGLGVGEPVMAAFGGLFVLVGLAVAVGLVRSIRVGKAWEAAIAVLDRWPVRMGEAARGWFHQTATADRSMADRVTATLVLRESATYRVGTDTRTATEDVARVPLVLEPEERDGRVGFGFTIAIPGEGPPTIDLPRNLVEWLIEFDVSETGSPDTSALFPVRVAAEVVP